MIGKHIKGREFSRTLRYVMTKPGAQLLGGTLLSLTPEEATLEFQAVARETTRTQKPLLHCALSLALGESLSNHQWRMLVGQYLQELGYCQNQFLLVRHTDTPSHEHVHVVVNRVGLNGKTVSDSWDYMRSQAVVRQLETQYGLSHAPLSWEKRKQKQNKATGHRHLFSEPPLHTLPPAVQEEVRWQSQLRTQLNSTLVTAYDLASFSEQLAHQGVQLRLLHRRGKAVGVSFVWEGQRIAGSRLGAAYSLPKLLTAINATDSAILRSLAQPIASLPSIAGEIHKTATEAHPFEPDETLPAAHQRYRQLEGLIRQLLGSAVTRRQIDLQIAQGALCSANPEEARALIHSPDIQQIRQHQGDRSALDYLKALMDEARQRAIVSSDIALSSQSRRNDPER